MRAVKYRLLESSHYAYVLPTNKVNRIYICNKKKSVFCFKQKSGCLNIAETRARRSHYTIMYKSETGRRGPKGGRGAEVINIHCVPAGGKPAMIEPN